MKPRRGFEMRRHVASASIISLLLHTASLTQTLGQRLPASSHKPRESWAYSAGTLVGADPSSFPSSPSPDSESDIDPAFIATPFNDSYLPLWDPEFDMRGISNLHMSARIADIFPPDDARAPYNDAPLAPAEMLQPAEPIPDPYNDNPLAPAEMPQPADPIPDPQNPGTAESPAAMPEPVEPYPDPQNPGTAESPAAALARVNPLESWSGPLPSEATAAAAGEKARGDIYSAEMQGYRETTAPDGTVMASGTVQYKAQNGTVLWIQALTAPLVKRPVLEYVNFYAKFAASTSATVEDFYSYLAQYNVSQYVNKTELIYVEVAGLPGLTSFLLACKYKVPLKTWAYVVTYVNEPGTVAFFFRGTDFSLVENVLADVCSVYPTVLNTTGGPPCPTYFGWPCLVGRGFQLSFDSVRDSLLPAWRRVAGVDASVSPTRILCGGHSLGGAVAGLCSVYMKGQVPTAKHEYVAIASPLAGNEPFRRFFQQGLAPTYLVTNQADPVPWLPWQIVTGYVYLKVPIWLISTSLINSRSIRALDTQRPQVGIYLNAFQHFADAYIKALDAAILNAPP